MNYSGVDFHKKHSTATIMDNNSYLLEKSENRDSDHSEYLNLSENQVHGVHFY